MRAGSSSGPGSFGRRLNSASPVEEFDIAGSPIRNNPLGVRAAVSYRVLVLTEAAVASGPKATKRAIEHGNQRDRKQRARAREQ